LALDALLRLHDRQGAGENVDDELDSWADSVSGFVASTWSCVTISNKEQLMAAIDSGADGLHVTKELADSLSLEEWRYIEVEKGVSLVVPWEG